MSNSFASPVRAFGEPFEPEIPDPCRHCGEIPPIMTVTVPAEYSFTGKDREKLVDIDACIAPLVEALNKGGCKTAFSCCSHGKGMGGIVLCDGREMLIFPDWKSTRRAEQILRGGGYFALSTDGGEDDGEA